MPAITAWSPGQHQVSQGQRVPGFGPSRGAWQARLRSDCTGLACAGVLPTERAGLGNLK